MEKSIESIWNEGFLNNDALVAPRVNNLYKQKSIHLIDKFSRMFKRNLVAIVLGSFVVLVASFLVDIPVMGVLLFILANTIVIVNKRLEKGLNKIDKNVSSYQYIKSFDNWMKKQLNVNRRMAHFYYPYIFVSMILGFFFSSNFQELYQEIIGNPNQIYFINGIPVFWMLSFVTITLLLAIFGGRIYNWDVNIVYGRVLKKLDEILSDMEELKK